MNKHNHIQAEQFPEVQSHTEAVSTIGASAVATAKITPPVTVSGFILAGHDMEDWVVVLTAIYTLLLIIHQLWKMVRDYRRRNNTDCDL